MRTTNRRQDMPGVSVSGEVAARWGLSSIGGSKMAMECPGTLLRLPAGLRWHLEVAAGLRCVGGRCGLPIRKRSNWVLEFRLR